MDEQFAQILIDRLITNALAGRSEIELLEELCKLLVESGVQLLRVSTATEQLHPSIGGQGYIWWRDSPTEQPSFPRRDSFQGQALRQRSPFDYLLNSGQTRQCFRLDDPGETAKFPVLGELKQLGATEYLAIAMRIGDDASLSSARDVAFSWCTDRSGGFKDAELRLIERVSPALALSVNSARNSATGRFLLATYLGSDAAQRVLSGNVVRGRADTIQAAIWFSDLADFTRMSSENSAATILAVLNEYAELLCDAIHAHGGHVLKFMGDGILAIFDEKNQEQSCWSALDAAKHALSATESLNRKRGTVGLATTKVKIALHFGQLLYGNFGSPNRLDFTVLGPAVNEASRIVALCRSLDQHVILSKAFAHALGPRRKELVSLGRYALKGVARPQELFTLDSMISGSS